MKISPVFLAALAAAALTSAGYAAAPSKPITGKHDNNAPITIDADNFQADLNAKSATYTGTVIAVQGDTKLRADQMHVFTVNGKADKLTANGHVVVDSPSGIATGDNGVYSVGPRTVVMTGNVVLKRGKDVLQGTQGTFNMATGEMALTGTKSAQNPSGRVRSVLQPGSQTQ